MKKVISFALSFFIVANILVFSGLDVFSASYQIFQTTHLTFSESDVLTDDISIVNNTDEGQNAVTVVKDPKDATNDVLKFSDLGTGTNNAYVMTYNGSESITKPTSIEYDIYFSNTSAVISLNLRASTGGYQYYQFKDGKIQFKGSTEAKDDSASSLTYEPNKWYTVKTGINFSENYSEISIAEKGSTDYKTARFTSTGINQVGFMRITLGFQKNVAGDVYVDNYKHYINDSILDPTIARYKNFADKNLTFSEYNVLVNSMGIVNNTGEGQNAATIVKDPSDSSNDVLKLSDLGTQDSNVYIMTYDGTESITKPTSIEFDIYFSNTSSVTSLNLRASTGGYQYYQFTNGKIQFKGSTEAKDSSGSSLTYEPNKWYTVKTGINFEENYSEISICEKGTNNYKTARFTSTGINQAGFVRITLGFQKNVAGDVYVDNYKHYINESIIDPTVAGYKRFSDKTLTFSESNVLTNDMTIANANYGSSITVVKDPKDNNNDVLKFTRSESTDASSGVYAYFYTNDNKLITKPFAIEFDIYFSNLNTVFSMNYRPISGGYKMYTFSKGTVQINGSALKDSSSNTVTYKEGKWYSLKMGTDINSQYSYIAIKEKDEPVWNIIKSPNQSFIKNEGIGRISIGFQEVGQGDVYMDNYKQYTDETINQTSGAVDKLMQNWDFTKVTQDKLLSSWTIKNEDSSAWALSSNGLTFTTCSGDMTASNVNLGTPENIFYIPTDGDYILDTKLEFTQSLTGKDGRGANLVIYQDDSNFLKLACQAVGSGRMYLQDVTNGATLSETAKTYTDTSVYLRVKKSDDTYSFYYSQDGTDFTKLGSDINKDYSSPKVALFVARNSENTVTFTYKYLNFSNVNSDVITLNKEFVHLKEGDTFKISAKGPNSDEVITYSSDDTRTASVTSDGLISANNEGYALITVANNYGAKSIVAVSVEPKEDIYSNHEGAPFLPHWEFIPDGEPRIFEDPEKPGEYRVYLYGSHDNRGDENWCGLHHVVWSAPVDDLSAWRYDGVLYEPIEGSTIQLNAPDVVEVVNPDGTKFYCIYPNSVGDGPANSVAFSDRPDGPFKVKEGTNGVVYGDPAVLVDDDGRVYAYWGSEAGSKCAELDPETMCTVKEGTTVKTNLPGIAACDSEDFNPSLYNIVVDGNERKFRFFEASSIRKVGNKYVMIWARAGDTTDLGGTRQHLAYAYSDSPLGPWKYGGNIVSSGGEAILNANGTYQTTHMSTNIHGSICQINNQWYIFYHRGLHGIKPRQAMVEPITLEVSEQSVENGGYVRISHVETTSNGFNLDGLSPYKEHSAGLASYLTGFSSSDKPFTTDYSREVTSLPIRNIKNGVVAGYKYFNFDKTIDSNITTLNLKLCPKGVDATVDIYARPVTAVNTPLSKQNGIVTSVGEGSFKIGTLNLTSQMAQTMTEFKVDVSDVNDLNGKWGIFLVFNSSSSDAICDFDTLKFASDMSTQVSAIITDNKVSAVSIENITSLPQGSVLYVGVYDKTLRCLKQIYQIALSGDNLSKGTKNITLPKTLTVEGDDIVKGYIWDSSKSPLSR